MAEMFPRKASVSQTGRDRQDISTLDHLVIDVLKDACITRQDIMGCMRTEGHTEILAPSVLWVDNLMIIYPSYFNKNTKSKHLEAKVINFHYYYLL